MSLPLWQFLLGVLGPDGTRYEDKNRKCLHLAPQAVFHTSLGQTAGLSKLMTADFWTKKGILFLNFRGGENLIG